MTVWWRKRIFMKFVHEIGLLSINLKIFLPCLGLHRFKLFINRKTGIVNKLFMGENPRCLLPNFKVLLKK